MVAKKVLKPKKTEDDNISGEDLGPEIVPDADNPLDRADAIFGDDDAEDGSFAPAGSQAGDEGTEERAGDRAKKLTKLDTSNMTKAERKAYREQRKAEKLQRKAERAERKAKKA